MNIRNMKNLAFAVAALALIAPNAHAQRRNPNGSMVVAPGNVNAYVFGNGYTYKGMNNYGTYSGFPNYSIGYPYAFNKYGGINSAGANGSVTVGGNGAVYPGYGSATINNSNEGITVNEGQDNLPPVAPVSLSDQIVVSKLSSNRVKIVWDGDPRPVAKMQFALLDSKKTALRSLTITDLPAEATFVRPTTAAYYRVVITYGDGAMRSLISAL